MVSSDNSWWHKHGWTLLLLLSAFSIAFLIRTLWVVPLFQTWGPSNFFAGGSDSFYHWRVSDYIILNHRNLVFDPLLKYPFGAINPREPLFDWMNAIFGIVFAPFFGGSAQAAGMFSLELAAPLWAALGVFPVYLIGKEVSSRRMGLIAALIYPFLAANIDSSTFGYANYLSFYTFFILIMLYGYLRTVRAAGTQRWVGSYRHPRDILKALQSFWRTERSAVKWAVFTGVAFGAVILTWQGYTFLVALVIVFLVVAMIIERIRRIDSFGLYVTTAIVGIVGFPMAFPYYFVQGDYHIWFAEPLLIYFGALLILLPFLLLRDSPWVISIPALIITSAAAVAALALAAPQTFADILSGQGYFVKTLIYTTVAEAQAPSVDSLIVGYGVVTFFLAFAGLAFVAYGLARQRFQRRHLIFLIFGVISIYLPISAAKFFYIGSVAFSLLPAEAVVRVLDIGGYSTLRRNVASLSDRRSQLGAFRRSFKARHVLVVLLILVIILPNIWFSIDAGIPYNSKAQYDTQVYYTLPPPLRTAPTNASSYYLGAAGSQLDTPNQYDEAGYNWLALQDNNVPEPQRPALVSWWDYGFQTISEGDHPAVADNFQNGIDPSGNFLLSQNESLAIGVLSATLLSAEEQKTGLPYLPASLNNILARDGVNLGELHSLLVNESNDVNLVVAHPDRYLPVNPSHIDGDNAMYDTVSYFLATTLPLSGVAQVYNDIQQYTGWSIRYAMVDSRLIPFSGSNTGIFYAPADLTDRVIGPGGEPTSYFNVTVVGSDGNTYPAGETPAGVTPVSYNINYLTPFYQSMIYRIYFGFNGSEVGQGSGIPGLSGNAGGDPVEPGWMLQHFQVVYRTAYYCPQANAVPGSSCFNATNVPQAVSEAAANNGTADTSSSSYFSGGEAMLEYYAGQPITGTVELPNGRPVSDARVTVYDAWGIPHMTTVTTSDGAYSLVLPPGPDVLNVSTGTLNTLTYAGATHLASINVSVPQSVGLSLDAPTIVQPIVIKPATIQGFVYWNVNNGSTYVPTTDPLVAGATVTLWGQNLTAETMTTDASGSFVFPNVAPSVYNVSILYHGGNFSGVQATALPGKTVNETTALSAGEIKGMVTGPTGSPVRSATVRVSNSFGVVAETATNATGNYSVSDLGPGNYTLVATVPPVGWGAAPAPATIRTPGSNITVNLTTGPLVPVSIEIVRNGLPAVNFPVRFTEIIPPVNSPPASNNSTAPEATTQQQANTSAVLTGPDGVARLYLAEGNYSVYALGYNGSGYDAGFWSGAVGPTGGNLPALTVSPAVPVSGLVNISAVASLAAPAEIAAYDSSGHVVWAFTNTSEDWSLWLPSGDYSFEASTVDPPAAMFKNVVVGGPTALSFTLMTGQVSQTSVTNALTQKPIAGASVSWTLVPLGVTVTSVSHSDGNVSAILTIGLPEGAYSYCINTTAAGYLPSIQCNVNPGQATNLPGIQLTPAPVRASILISGAPPGTNVQVNVTATCSTCGTSVSVSGQSPFSLSLSPGTYEVSAWAPSTGAGTYRPPSPVNWTVPVGISEARVALGLLLQVSAHGTINAPAGTLLSNAEVSLYSSSMNVSIDGTGYTHGFSLAPGVYQYYATSPSGVEGVQESIQYGQVYLNASGSIAPTIALDRPATSVAGTVFLPGGAIYQTPIVVTFVASSGITIQTTASGGTFTVFLPYNTTFAVRLSFTGPVSVNNQTILEALTVPPGDACSVATSPAPCDIHLIGTPVPLVFAGNLTSTNAPSGVAGTVRITGPAPSNDVTTIQTAANGSFSTKLASGTYELYANSTSGSEAADATLFIAATNETGQTFQLAPSWTARATVLPPVGESIGPVALSFSSFGRPTLTFNGIAPGTPFSIALPPGTYVVNASASSNPFGVSTNATASVTLSLLFGNGAATLPLTEQIVRTASLSFNLGSNNGNITLPASGGTVTLGYVIHNTGNAPENLTIFGSPGSWNFTLVPKSFELGVSASNSSATGTVTIRVPGGTPVAHPAVVLQANLAGTSIVAGQSIVPPPIAILAKTGIELGGSPTVAPAVSPSTVTLALYALNTGNVAETVALSVVDGARLSMLGWSSSLRVSGTTLTGPTTIDEGGNTSVSVVLNASSGNGQPPGSVTVEATVHNASGAAATSIVTIKVPVVSVSLNGSTVTVTGPGIGSPSTTPDWLVPVLALVPAIAFFVGAVAYRWYRTRRWIR